MRAARSRHPGGWRAQPVVDTNAPWALATGLLMAAAMGVQNAAGRLAFAALAPTTVMTGNVTQLVIDLVDPGARRCGPGRPRAHPKFLWPVVAFAIGAIGGAFAYLVASFWALALPLALLIAMAAWPVDR